MVEVEHGHRVESYWQRNQDRRERYRPRLHIERTDQWQEAKGEENVDLAQAASDISQAQGRCDIEQSQQKTQAGKEQDPGTRQAQKDTADQRDREAAQGQQAMGFGREFSIEEQRRTSSARHASRCL